MQRVYMWSLSVAVIVGMPSYGQAFAATVQLVQEAPPAPADLGATAVNESRIDLSWTAVPETSSYHVKRSASGSGPFATIASSVSGTGFSDLGLSAGTTYYYVVSAANSFGESPDSSPADATTLQALRTVEAESGTLGADFNTLGANPTCITCSTDGAGNNPGSADRVASYSVTFPTAGTYELYARIYVGPNTYNDDSMFFANSFGTKSPASDADWVMANGLAGVGFTASGSIVTGEGTAGSQTWKWINLSQYTSTERFAVVPGNLTQTFQIGARENGLNVDKVVFGKVGYPFTVANLNNGTTPVLDMPIDSSVVDWSDVHQRIDGFGAGVVFLYSGLDPITDANANRLFGTNSSQFGLSLLRIRISPDGNNSANISDAKKAVARGARVMATPWTPPASMKDNGSTVGGSLLPGKYASYAAYLNNFAATLKANGVELAAISMQNEPDIEVSYESCDWTPQQIRTFCRDYAGAITNAPFMIAESFNFNKSVYDPTLNDPVAVQNVDIVAGHLYGTTVSDYPNARAKGKPVWMTEYLENDQTWPSSMQTAEQIHDCLVNGNMSAYIWWKTTGDANGLLNNAGAPQKRGYMMGQFSRFVRPDDYRIGVNSAGAAKISAYKNASGGLSIVAVNHTGVDIDQLIKLTNCTVTGALVPWVTSSSLSLAAQPPVDVFASSFAYTLPAMSVVTFTGQITDANLNSIATPSISGNGDLLISYNGVSGLDYVLESTGNLDDPSWIPLSTNTAEAAGMVDFTGVPTDPQKFYRARSDSSAAYPTYP